MPLAAALEQLGHQLKMYRGTAGIGRQARHGVTVDHACGDAFPQGVVQAPADAADFFIVAQHGTWRAVGADSAEIHAKKLAALRDKIITRILRLLTREGHLVEEVGRTHRDVAARIHATARSAGASPAPASHPLSRALGAPDAETVPEPALLKNKITVCQARRGEIGQRSEQREIYSTGGAIGIDIHVGVRAILKDV